MSKAHGPDHEEWLRGLGMRMHRARREAGMTLEELAKRLGVSKQLLSNQANARSEISSYHLFHFARLTKADPAWLLSGEVRQAPGLPSGLAYLVPRVRLDKKIVGISRVLAADMTDRVADLLEKSFIDNDRVLTRAKVSAGAFAFDNPDRALDPDLQYGDLVVVDVEVPPAAGDFALFCLTGTSEFLLRGYEPHKSGDPKAPFTLTALNRLFPPRVITPEHGAYCLGSVVEATRVYERDPISTAGRNPILAR